MGLDNLHRLKENLQDFDFEKEGEQLLEENKGEFESLAATIGKGEAYNELILPRLKALFTQKTGLGWRPEYNISSWMGKTDKD